jgi:hypothetical protein
MATLLKQSSLHPDHPLRVEIPLQLGRETQLAEHVAAGRAVEHRSRQVGHDERDLVAVQLVLEVEHEPGVPSQPREVVHREACDFAGSERPQESLVAVPGSAEPRLWPPESEITRTEALAGRSFRQTASCISSLTC